jgi:hypothetical protein
MWWIVKSLPGKEFLERGEISEFLWMVLEVSIPANRNPRYYLVLSA